MKTRRFHWLQIIFPCSWVEWALWAFFLLAYGSLSVDIAQNFRIIFDDRIPWDAYFSFDNRAIVMTGGGYERHPLSNYFFEAIRTFSLWVSSGQKGATFRTALALLSTFTVSLSMVQVYKYLRNIIALSITPSLLLVGFFSLFSTNILLSFTPETYTYTLFFLTTFNYYAALKLKHHQKLSFGALTIASITIGGLTITNIVKVYIPVLFEKGAFRTPKEWLKTSAKVLGSFGIFMLLFMSRVGFQFSAFLDKSGQQYEKFSQPKVVPVWDMVVSWFWGGNMLFSSFLIRDYHYLNQFHYKALFMEAYSAPMSYIFVGVIFLLIVWGYLKNFKKPLVQILMLSFLVDVVIHAVLKFGLHTAYIYGGHFIFIVPLMLGWLYASLKSKYQNYALMVLIILTLFLALNNGYRMQEFFEFLHLYYQ
ncbi:DUF6080 domain-containing protein [Riemerella columbina]|uniref:DUF6080 domain-containing protein n=1 Tax=Riemerella columbina TaxID=103810 RepID=UPI0026704245|nr:DUF6080 domain-containing protein [Riemerella columbina]WKS95202.1 DUF6080 domain-containing protein [Riemerella columbina]